MANTRVSTIRAKCYMVLEGLENSLAETLKRPTHLVDEPSFMTEDEKKRALSRLRDDLEDNWTLEDVYNEDLLGYLDLGDLVALLNRHKSKLREVSAEHIKQMTDCLDAHSVYTLRNRVMHPLRAIDADHFTTLMYVASQLQKLAPSLAWQSLRSGVLSAGHYERLLNVAIPTYWLEGPSQNHIVPNNLPAGEFGDTGFVGREQEKRQVKNLLDSYNRVITVIGPGGTGKTALTLRVCHDLIEEADSPFDRIVWVSLKTKYLTADGVKDINNAISTPDVLADHLSLEVANRSADDLDSPWEPVFQEMEKSSILLVVDNLETLGREIIDLADGIPPNSKLLLTSRIGLGEIERLYRMPDLSPKDAGILMRSLGGAYNCEPIKTLPQATLSEYCSDLHHNPLLIKWFVHAVNKGAAPTDVLSRDGISEALAFCWRNVYQGLSRTATKTLAILLASRQNLSRSELQELTHKLENMDIDVFHDAIVELHQANIIEFSIEKDRTEIYQIGSLIREYLNNYHKPSGGVFRDTREQLKQLQIEQEARNRRRQVYRYNRDNVHAQSRGQEVAARHLDAALRHIRERHAGAAMESLNIAEEMEPTWWEVHRVKAMLGEVNLRPVYEIEEAYEESIRYDDNDINRHHYAIHLMHEDQFDRALEQVEAALKHPEAIHLTLRGIKGRILTLQNRYEEAIEEFEYIWQETESASRLPIYVRKMQGTQFADCRRRQVEHLISLGRGIEEKTFDYAVDSVRIVDQTAQRSEWDAQLVNVGIKALREINTLANVPGLDSEATVARKAELSMYSQKWDTDGAFRLCFKDRRVVNTFQRDAVIIGLMKRTAQIAHSTQFARIITGVVESLHGRYGFIKTEEDGQIFMDRRSLRNSGDWMEIQESQLVRFNVEPPPSSSPGKLPRAVFLEMG